MSGHEIDDFGRDLFGGDGEVPFVLPVLIVHHHQDAPGADLFNRFRDRHKRHNPLYL
jgi:hypothetical protein